MRCGCVCFTHNALVPGASCECGHLACYHMSASDVPSPGKNHDAIEGVKRRVVALEQQLEAGRDHRDINSIVVRLSQLEETADKNREDLQGQVKASYRNIAAAWQLIEELKNKMASYEDHSRAHSEQLHNLSNRHLELLETDEMLEERIEKLEGMDTLPSPAQEAATSDVFRVANLTEEHLSAHSRRLSCTSRQKPLSLMPGGDATTQSFIERKSGNASTTSGSWTVHVSVLPSQHQSFPFEKDSIAYKRCLSRGLQQMVAVEGSSGDCFVAAVSKAFEHILKDAAWEPMRIRSSKAGSIEDPPALQPLEPNTSTRDYRRDFLQEMCAVCDGQGRMMAIYLAITDNSFTWSKVRSLPVYIRGLEASWKFDESLDLPRIEDIPPGALLELRDRGQHEARPASSSPEHANVSTLKRSSSEVQAAGMATRGATMLEPEGPLAKRKCLPDMIKTR